MYTELKTGAAALMSELLELSKLRPGDIVVVGCSSSELIGQRIGKGSAPEAALAVLSGLLPVTRQAGLYLAAQCCEHLNRALIIERDCAEKYGYEIVNVRPRPKAGGSFATAAFESFADPVAVEYIRAGAGIDIGDTFIGMHLRPVAVPVRLSAKQLGEAHVTAARTRPRMIGGVRAEYLDI